MELDLQGRRVLVSGSSQGIGKAIARAFLKEGAIVIINGRNREKLESTHAEFVKEFDTKHIVLFCGDLTKNTEIHLLRECIQNELGGIDILVPNIGTGKAMLQDMLEAEEWQRLLEINLFSTIKLVKEFEDMLKKGYHPNIVFISSVAGKEVSGAPYAYAAAKEAILVLAKRLSEDWAQYGIRVNSVLPGNILFKGGRWEEILEQNYNGTMQQIHMTVAMQRLGTPEEIASAVVFLASNQASFITGTSLTVDGGQCKGI